MQTDSLTRGRRINYYLRNKNGEHLKELKVELGISEYDMKIIVDQGRLDYEGDKYELAHFLMNGVRDA